MYIPRTIGSFFRHFCHHRHEVLWVENKECKIPVAPVAQRYLVTL